MDVLIGVWRDLQILPRGLDNESHYDEAAVSFRQSHPCSGIILHFIDILLADLAPEASDLLPLSAQLTLFCSMIGRIHTFSLLTTHWVILIEKSLKF